VATDYVGLDPSYTGFGAVVLHEDGTYDQFLGKFAPQRWKTPRLYEVEDWLNSTVIKAATAEQVRVLREGYAPGAKFGREMAGELGGLVNSVVFDWIRREPILVSPGTIKKMATGKGSGDKNLILLNVYKRWGVDISNDNIADAYVLARIGEALDRTDLLKYEKEVVAAVRKGDPDPSL
jgi:crossover junction endodeoxyribonuclease RuvC